MSSFKSENNFGIRKATVEVLTDLNNRLLRTVLTALGTAIGIAVLVATTCLAASASANINVHFEALNSTDITIKAREGWENSSRGDHPLTRVNLQGAYALSGVEAVARVRRVNVESVRGVPHDDWNPSGRSVAVVAASPGLADAVGASLRGRFHEEFHSNGAYPVAVVGSKAAELLGVSILSRSPIVFLNEQPVTVIGILDKTDIKQDLLDVVIVSEGFAAKFLAPDQPDEILVKSKTGASQRVVSKIRQALTVTHFNDLQAFSPPVPTVTRGKVSGDVKALLVALSLVSLLVGGIGIANVTLVSVLERTSEIGLRRSLGATRGNIMLHFLLESSLTGVLGAVFGNFVGVVSLLSIASFLGWPPVVEPYVLFVSPVIGGLAGFAAGAYPAWRASVIHPSRALRTG